LTFWDLRGFGVFEIEEKIMDILRKVAMQDQ